MNAPGGLPWAFIGSVRLLVTRPNWSPSVRYFAFSLRTVTLTGEAAELTVLASC
jgi:hypothetical protein